MLIPPNAAANECRAGCQQTVVSEYTHTSLSAGQQSALVEAFGLLSKRQHNGISVGSVLLVNEERVAGMARCDDQPASYRGPTMVATVRIQRTFLSRRIFFKTTGGLAASAV